MSKLPELQAPIDIEIVNSMIASTPEEWTSILLVLKRDRPNKKIGEFTHELSSPQGHSPICPDNALFEATYKLDELLQMHGGVLCRAEYLANFSDGQWNYESKFEYQ